MRRWDGRASELLIRLHRSVTISRSLDDDRLFALVEGARFSIGELSKQSPLIQGLASGIPVWDEDHPTEFLNVLTRLVQFRLVEFVVVLRGQEIAKVEPGFDGEWPRIVPFTSAARLRLSAYALVRRRGHSLIIESAITSFVVVPSSNDFLSQLLSLARSKQKKRSNSIMADDHICGLLVGLGILEDTAAPGLPQWEFHDLLFHRRSRRGWHVGVAGRIAGDDFVTQAKRHPEGPQLPLIVKPSWFEGGRSQIETNSRRSVRRYDFSQALDFDELSEFLFRGFFLGSCSSRLYNETEIVARAPYPSAGACYPLQVYLVTRSCESLPVELYRYCPLEHCLITLGADPEHLSILLSDTKASLGGQSDPHALVILSAQFEKVFGRYRSIAYSLILKDVGVVMQHLYDVASGIGLAACAIGTGNSKQFALLTGLDPLIEGSVGEFAIGKAAPEETKCE